MVDLIMRLHIEEVNRGSERKHVVGEKDNMMEHGQGSKHKKYNFGKGAKLAPMGGISKSSKFQGKCFIFDKVGHILLTVGNQRRRKKATW